MSLKSEKQNFRNNIARILSGVDEPRMKGLTLRSLHVYKTEENHCICPRCKGERNFEQEEWSIDDKYASHKGRVCFVCGGYGKFVLPKIEDYLGACLMWIRLKCEEGSLEEVVRVGLSECKIICEGEWVEQAAQFWAWVLDRVEAVGEGERFYPEDEQDEDPAFPIYEKGWEKYQRMLVRKREENARNELIESGWNPGLLDVLQNKWEENENA